MRFDFAERESERKAIIYDEQAAEGKGNARKGEGARGSVDHGFCLMLAELEQHPVGVGDEQKPKSESPVKYDFVSVEKGLVLG